MKNYIDIDEIKTIKGLESFKKTMNEAIDAKIHEMVLANKAKNVSSKNFGYLKESFENLSTKLFGSKAGKLIIKKYTDTINENKNLSTLHRIYENIRKAHKDIDVDYFINSLVNEDWKINKRTLKEDLSKLGKIVEEGYMLLGDNSDELLSEEKETLDKAVMYISENAKTSKNIVEYSNAIKIIKDEILTHGVNENVFESKKQNVDDLLERLISEFNDKYSGKLTNEEVEMIRHMALNENNEDSFEAYKSDCLTKIKEAREAFINNGDSESADRLSAIYEQVENKSYCNESFEHDMNNLLEITKILL